MKDIAPASHNKVQYLEILPDMQTESNLAGEAPRSFRIDEELDHVLQSVAFHGSKQCQALLRYVVGKSLEGHDLDGAFKERTLGVEVFGRKHDYNTGEDAIVRVRVGEVRKRLAQYYLSPEGQASPVQIVIPQGSYRPTFTFRPDKESENKKPAVRTRPQAEPSADADERSEPGIAPVSRSPIPIRWLAWGITGVAAFAVLLVTWMEIANRNDNNLDLFWARFLKSDKPVVIYIGTAPLYVPTAAFGEKIRSVISPDELQRPMIELPLPSLIEGQVLTAKDVQPNRTDYVASDDVHGVVDVAMLLAAHGRSLELRSGTNMPFEDLRGSPVVLTGAGSNYWSLDMTRNLPFFIDRGLRIRERGGQGRVWSTSLWLPHAITDDYAIVSRLLDSKTGAPVIILAGLNSCGTRAAGEFVTNSVQLKRLGSIRRDALEHKNLEIVLHTTVVDCNPISIDIVDLREW